MLLSMGQTPPPSPGNRDPLLGPLFLFPTPETAHWELGAPLRRRVCRGDLYLLPYLAWHL